MPDHISLAFLAGRAPNVVRQAFYEDAMSRFQLSRAATETLIVSLIAAAVSGLAFVAYKHPAGYRWLAIGLASITILNALYSVAYRLGHVEQAIRSLNERLSERPNDPLGSVAFVITGLSHDTARIARLALITALVLGYLALLWFLPAIVSLASPNVGTGL